MLKVKISLTYRGVPYEIAIEASDKTDITFLLSDALGSIIDSIQKFIDSQIKGDDKFGLDSVSN